MANLNIFDYILEHFGAVKGLNGAVQTMDGALATKITASGGYTYIGEAMPGASQASAVWRCQQIDSNGSVLWADGNSDFDNVATDLTALSYS